MRRVQVDPAAHGQGAGEGGQVVINRFAAPHRKPPVRVVPARYNCLFFLEFAAAMSLANPKVGFVSLGCPKALVDSERILTQLKVEGYDLVPTYDDADVVVVNTCGFIDSAVAESLDAIGEALAENGKVIVTGCLGKREEIIREAHPGVLSISGPQDYASVMEAVHTALPPSHDPFLDLLPDYGLKLTPKHYAYLKISEGC